VATTTPLLLLAPRRPGRGRRRPPQARPQLLGHDLNGGPGAAVPAVQLRCCSRPTTTTRLPFDHDCSACSAWSRQTMTVKKDGSCSRRPDTATRNMARAMPDSVCRSSGSSVRLPAKLTLASVMVLPLSVAWPGGLPCPWNRGTVDTVACRKAIRGKRQSQRGRPWIKLAGRGRLGCRVGWWGACGWGRACQHRPARSLHPGRGGRTRLPPRGPLRPVPGDSR
jgi:hypothetical protein